MGGYLSKSKTSNMATETETGNKFDEEDNSEQVDSTGWKTRPGLQKHPCNFCDGTFTSEIDLLCHFREAHYQAGELSSDSDDDNDEEDEIYAETKEEEGSANVLDFLTDRERALLSQPVSLPVPESEEGDEDDGPLELEVEGDDEPVEDFFPKTRDQTPAREARSNSKKAMQKSTKVKVPKSVLMPDSRKSSRVRGRKTKAKCAECGYTPHDKRRLAAHMEVHNPQGKNFKCSECNCYFTKENALLSHVRNFHRKNGEEKTEEKTEEEAAVLLRLQECIEVVPSENAKYKKLFKCKLCGRLSTQAGNARYHVRIVHWRQLPFKCDQCSRGFGRKYDMKAHRLVVHGGDPDPQAGESEN